MKVDIIDNDEIEDLIEQVAHAVRKAPPGTIFDEITVLSHGDDGGLIIKTTAVPRGFVPGKLKKKKKTIRARRRR